MGSKSKIEWTETTWNPVTGCTKISSGCKHCYAERMAERLQAMGNKRYQNGFGVTLHEDKIDQPFHWEKPRMIFVNSMSDLFHEKVPHEFMVEVFQTMVACRQHIFQILTKRSGRLKNDAPLLPWPENVWMGVSVENEEVVYRIEDLKQVPAKIRFLSLEPLIGPLDNLILDGIDWVIVGGESGPGARPMDPQWVRSILDQCKAAKVPFFFKQWGGVNKHRTGRMIEGETFDEYPASLHNHQEEFAERILSQIGQVDESPIAIEV